jgi:sirohydrochlorin ferrochelatase
VSEPSPAPATPTALLLIAHGSRQPEANADLQELAGRLRNDGPYLVVQPSFLELAEPTIEDGAHHCVEQGARKVILLPYFLSAGVHVRRDLAQMQRRLAERYPNVEFLLAEPLGRHPLLVPIVLQRAQEARGR